MAGLSDTTQHALFEKLVRRTTHHSAHPDRKHRPVSKTNENWCCLVEKERKSLADGSPASVFAKVEHKIAQLRLEGMYAYLSSTHDEVDARGSSAGRRQSADSDKFKAFIVEKIQRARAFSCATTGRGTDR